MEFEGLSEAVRVVTGSLSGAINTISQIKSLADSGEKVSPEVSEAVVRLSLQTAEMKLQLAELELQLRSLEVRSKEEQSLEGRKKNYEMAETPVGDKVYRLKETANTGELPHDVCLHCFENGKISVLQSQGRWQTSCAACGADVQYDKMPPPFVVL